MAFSGWFPHVSPSGAHVVTGTGELWIDQAQIVGYGFQGVPSATQAWFNDTTILFLSTATPGTPNTLGLWSCAVGQTKQPLGVAGNFYQLVVAAGRWAGWDASGIRTSWGQTITADQPRSPALSTGHFAYLANSTAVLQRLVLDGVTIDTAPIIDPMLSDQGLCWVRWTAGVREIWGLRLDIPDVPAKVTASDATEWQALPIDTPDGPWILSTDANRLLLRPWGLTTGYVVATGQLQYPHGVYTSAGRFRMVWNTAAGIYGETVIDPASARTDLGGTVDPVTPGETTPGSPGSTDAGAAILPPLRHPILETTTGLVTKPWATWFEQQAQQSAPTPYAYVPANSIIGRGTSAPGPATTLTVGLGLMIRDGALVATGETIMAVTVKTQDFSLSATGTVVSAITGKRIKVFAIKLIVDADLAVAWRSASTALEGPQALAINGGYTESVAPPSFLLATNVGEALDLSITGTGTASGRVSYWDTDSV